MSRFGSVRFGSVACVLALLFVTIGNMQARFVPFAPDSCLKLVWEHDPENGKFNPDSVMVDTCDATHPNYASCGFFVLVPSQVLDSLCDVEGGYNSIDCIDTLHSSWSFWVEQHNRFGNYEIRLNTSWFDNDSVFIGHQYEIRFDSRVNVRLWKELADSLCLSAHTHYRGTAWGTLSLSGHMSEASMCSSVDPDEIGEFVYIGPELEPEETIKTLVYRRQYFRGLSSDLREIKVPMAWNVTKGLPTVYTAIGDWDGVRDDESAYSHVDMSPTEQGGNFFHFNNQRSGQYPASRTSPLSMVSNWGHTIRTLGVIAAQENKVGFVGVAPGTRMLVVVPGQILSDISSTHGHVHVNPTALGDNRLPNILTTPNYAVSGAESNHWLNMSQGIMHVGTVGNYLDYSNNNLPFPKVDSPHNSVYTSRHPLDDKPADPRFDVKPIISGGYSSNWFNVLQDPTVPYLGYFTNDDCTRRTNQFTNNGITGNFGNRTANKFDMSESAFERMNARNKAPLDIVVPNCPIALWFDKTTGASQYTTEVGGGSFSQGYRGPLITTSKMLERVF